MRTINQKIEERLDRWLADIKVPIRSYIQDCMVVTPYNGDKNDKAAINEYCLYRIAEGMNEYLRSTHYSAVVRQKQYEKFKQTIIRICASHHIEGANRFIELMDIPIVSDPAIAFVKALHPRNGKSKEDLVEELGISERMVRLNVRKLDHKQLITDGEDPGEFRVGGQIVSVPIRVDEDENGKKYYCTPNTMQPLVMQLNVYQTAVVLDSLWKEYEEESGIAIELAATIWGQLSEYTQERIRFVWGTYKEGFEDFLDEVEELLEDGYDSGFLKEKDLFTSDNASIEDKLMMAYKTSKYVNIFLFGREELLKRVHVRPFKDENGKRKFYAFPGQCMDENSPAFYVEEVRDLFIEN